jgi:hypothetical protein
LLKISLKSSNSSFVGFAIFLKSLTVVTNFKLFRIAILAIRKSNEPADIPYVTPSLFKEKGPGDEFSILPLPSFFSLKILTK